MKNCTKCNKQKSLDEFYRSKQSKDGRRWQCKACDYKSTIKSRKSKCPMCGNNLDGYQKEISQDVFMLLVISRRKNRRKRI